MGHNPVRLLRTLSHSEQKKSKKRQKRVLTERVEGDIVIKLSQRDGAAGEQS